MAVATTPDPHHYPCGVFCITLSSASVPPRRCQSAVRKHWSHSPVIFSRSASSKWLYQILSSPRTLLPSFHDWAEYELRCPCRLCSMHSTHVSGLVPIQLWTRCKHIVKKHPLNRYPNHDWHVTKYYAKDGKSKPRISLFSTLPFLYHYHFEVLISIIHIIRAVKTYYIISRLGNFSWKFLGR